jgi:hypothetical protein
MGNMKKFLPSRSFKKLLVWVNKFLITSFPGQRSEEIPFLRKFEIIDTFVSEAAEVNNWEKPWHLEESFQLRV